MSFDSAPSEQVVLDTLLAQIDADFSAAELYEQLVEKIKKTKAHVKEDAFGLMTRGLPYTRVTVAKKDEANWALIFSISHVVADGYTYNKALCMLSGAAGSEIESEAIVPLNPARHREIVANLKGAVGQKEVPPCSFTLFVFCLSICICQSV